MAKKGEERDEKHNHESWKIIWHCSTCQRQNIILKRHYEVIKLTYVYNTLEKYVAYVFPDTIISSCKEKTSLLTEFVIYI